MDQPNAENGKSVSRPKLHICAGKDEEKFEKRTNMTERVKVSIKKTVKSDDERKGGRNTLKNRSRAAMTKTVVRTDNGKVSTNFTRRKLMEHHLS